MVNKPCSWLLWALLIVQTLDIIKLTRAEQVVLTSEENASGASSKPKNVAKKVALVSPIDKFLHEISQLQIEPSLKTKKSTDLKLQKELDKNSLESSDNLTSRRKELESVARAITATPDEMRMSNKRGTPNVCEKSLTVAMIYGRILCPPGKTAPHSNMGTSTPATANLQQSDWSRADEWANVEPNRWKSLVEQMVRNSSFRSMSTGMPQNAR